MTSSFLLRGRREGAKNPAEIGCGLVWCDVVASVQKKKGEKKKPGLVAHRSFHTKFDKPVSRANLSEIMLWVGPGLVCVDRCGRNYPGGIRHA